MRLEYKENKELAFDSFFRALRWGKGTKNSHFLDFFDIPSELLIKSPLLRKIPLGKYTFKQREILLKVERTFNKLWDRHFSDLQRLKSLWEQSIKKHETFLLEIIPRYTGEVWPYEEVIFFPSIRAWASSIDNRITIGIVPEIFLTKDFFGVMIHELIHVNTSSLELPDLKHERDSHEIADTLLVNKILINAKKELGIENRPQRLAVPFRKYEPELATLEDLAVKNLGFKNLVNAVDKFLISAAHKVV